MKKSELHELLLETAGRLLEIEPNLEAAWRNILNTEPGTAAANVNGGGHGGGGDTQPERLAGTSDANHRTLSSDLAHTARAELAVHLRSAFASAAAAARIVNAWTPTSERTTSPLGGKQLDPGDWCSSCLRIGKCAPRHRGDLCRWCYDFKTANQHRMPPIELVRMHHEGRRITEEAVKGALAIRS